MRIRTAFFFFLGIILLLTFPEPRLIATSRISGEPEVPEFLSIPSLLLSLPVQSARRERDTWQITDEKSAFFAEGSSQPGEKGTAVFFAHNRNGLFGLLPNLKIGEKIIIRTKSFVYVYTVSERRIIDPADISFVNADHKRLAVFTCFGKNDARRIVFFAEPISNIRISALSSVLYHI